MATRKPQQPKPYPDFPLFLHATGQWAKKVRGRMRYFGTDPDDALKRYLAERDDLYAGREPRGVAGLTVEELCNEFVDAKRLLADGGEMSLRTWQDYFDCAKQLVKLLGKAARVAALQPADFTALRAKLAKTLGPVALGNRVQRIRTMFNYAFESGLVEAPMRFGPDFKKPSRKTVRRARAAAGSRMMEAADIRAVLGAAGPPMRAMVLLAINCGYGQTDVAALPRAALDLKAGYATFPRPKTEVARRCPLWPETVAAVRKAIAARPAGKDGTAGLVFVTRQGRPWVRVVDRSDRPKQRPTVAIDSVQLEFQKLLRKLGLHRPGLGFYALRHTFQTVAERSKDFPAVGHIMGHADESMAATYRERIDDDRLAAVVDTVRAWLWPAAGKATRRRRAS